MNEAKMIQKQKWQ